MGHKQSKEATSPAKEQTKDQKEQHEQKEQKEQKDQHTETPVKVEKETPSKKDKETPAKKEKETPAKPKPAEIVNFTTEYEVVKKIHDAHYGEVGLIKEKNTERIMLLKKVIATTKEGYEAELRLCEQRAALANNDNIVHVIGYNHKEEKSFCSNFHNILVFIENYEKTLLDTIKEATTNEFYFSEPETLFLAENMISCLAYFQTHGLTHGDIRPFNIFVGADSYKISDPTLGPQKDFNGYLAALIKGEKTFIAPEQIKHLAAKEHEVKVTFKSDVFALGATLLSFATLTNSEDLFDFSKGTINENLLNERLEKLRTRFSPFTFDLIRDMLIFEETMRPDFVNLEGRLLPYRSYIRAKTPIYASKPINDDDDILKRVAEQLARSQELRASIENGTLYHHQEANNGRVIA